MRAHAVAELPLTPGDVGAQQGDLPRDVAARDHRKRRLQPGGAGQDHRIEAVEGGGLHAEDRVHGSGDRIRELLEPELRDGSVLVEDDGSHGSMLATSSSKWLGWKARSGEKCGSPFDGG